MCVCSRLYCTVCTVPHTTAREGGECEKNIFIYWTNMETSRACEQFQSNRRVRCLHAANELIKHCTTLDMAQCLLHLQATVPVQQTIWQVVHTHTHRYKRNIASFCVHLLFYVGDMRGRTAKDSVLTTRAFWSVHAYYRQKNECMWVYPMRRAHKLSRYHI